MISSISRFAIFFPTLLTSKYQLFYLLKMIYFVDLYVLESWIKFIQIITSQLIVAVLLLSLALLLFDDSEMIF